MGDIRDWPRPLPAGAIGRYRPTSWLNLSQLEPAEKAAHWQEIREQQPALAALLAEPGFQALRTQFNADVMIETEPHD
ncbi:hypothetical protein CAI21_01415 [Alkalilimnicola ehrlichii]|uniref:Uncharacterized protein n=1 Tax=Alkalilimnicola ehrlichii TaxID=351052 RepID=A0A3E0X1C7_9GAMM|nr:hypothetical protein [Alkalilimnicola ehrlichii]RFA31315.1 hypothetical protein CAI21_01415 [Alkalilimnicola ehrlichii]RFA39411.1 hypothetical protein CAL65_00995 [Alkalilimnicola ehrlichii]